MRSAKAIELGDAEQMRGGKSLGRWIGRDDDDALNARNLRGNRSHQQCRGQAGDGHWERSNRRS